jgi:hypothetical protein
MPVYYKMRVFNCINFQFLSWSYLLLLSILRPPSEADFWVAKENAIAL